MTKGMIDKTIELTVNGASRSATAEVRSSLADFLREKLELTGTHLGCEHGVCGACTVLVNGEPVRSCLMLAVQADGADVVTIEGLADGDTLHPLQQAFMESFGFQCGFCTPGFVLMTRQLLAEYPDPDEDAIRHYLSGNLCRCAAYPEIIEAVKLAAKKSKLPPRTKEER
jgi:aerobic-type carbon monoxide dehydrogenase small subunit (CoxS/CutS family)